MADDPPGVRTGGASRHGNAVAGHHGHQGLPHGFVSRAQQRYFFANPYLRARFAEKEAHKAGEMHVSDKPHMDPAYERLPEHVTDGVPSPVTTDGPSTLGGKAKGKAT
jgi:hypothetical protein